MMYLMTSLILCFILVLGSIVLLLYRRSKKRETELVVLRETPFTAVWALFLILLSGVFSIAKLAGYEIGGTDRDSFIFAALFALLCASLGAFMLLFTFQKRIVAYEDRMLVIDILGREKTVPWICITRVQGNIMSKRLVFYVNEEKIAVNGEMNSYKRFIALARKKIPAVAGADMLDELQ
jgi:heme/copper-type cytochrome/quinol oxidase subunit 2